MFSWFKSRGLPSLSGAYKVGCADYLSASPDSTIIRIYYPIEPTVTNEDFPLVHWLPRIEYAKFLVNSENGVQPGFIASTVGKILHWHAGKSTIPANWQAPLLKQKNIHDSTPDLPCVVFSHGMMGNRCVYSTFCLELASKGCVVAALEHRDKSASFTYDLKYEGSDLVEEWIHRRVLQKDEDEYELRSKQVQQRAKECIKTLDFLEELNTGTCPENLMDKNFDLQQFKGFLDTSKAAIVGHSFGSSSVILSLSQEKRFKCGVALDIWMYPISKMLHDIKVTQPTLLISNKDWQWESNIKQMKELRKTSLQGEQVSVMISGTDHLSQSDVPSMMSKAVVKFFNSSTVDSHEVLHLNNRPMWEFISRKLGLKTTEDEPLLDGGEGLPEFITIEPLEEKPNPMLVSSI